MFQVCRRRAIGGVVQEETAYGLTSLAPGAADAARLLALNRGHWAIENRLHGLRDGHFGEDACRVRTGAAPQLLAATRNAAAHLLEQSGVPNKAAALRRFAIVPLAAAALLDDSGEN